MIRFSRINTIWRKELIDTLRDRRTLIAMILVPMVLYPAMMLGSLQGFELQVSRLKQEEYKVAVTSEAARAWLRQLIDSDPARRPLAESRPAEELVAMDKRGELKGEPETRPAPRDQSAAEAARADVREQPPPYDILVVPHQAELAALVAAGTVHVAVLVPAELPNRESTGSATFTLMLDQTDIRSQIATSGLEAILQRAGDYLLGQRLKRANLEPAFIRPLEVRQAPIASPEKVGGSILGQIVPLILVIMTITGAIYPAIDLTAGERERGTLETLMVAPVPTVDLIAGKFVVVALIAMLSAALNLLSIGGTIYLGGLGKLLSQGGTVVIPLGALPWVLLVLIPLAVMFSAALLAVCSFARSFKEAQNYVMPVMVAAMIPAVVGILPGTRLSGPLLIMPVTNIVILTRDLFMGRFDVFAIVWVTLSTTLYAGAAVAVAAKLFGQEAVLFADSGSIKTIFKRRFFKPSTRPTTSQAFLVLAVVFSANFFAQQQLLTAPGIAGTMWFWIGLAAIIVTLFLAFPLVAAAYMRVRIAPAFAWHAPPLMSLVAALCFGLSTWVLAQAWFAFQQTWLTMPVEMEQAYEQMVALLGALHPLVMIVFLALIPAICEECLFRGYVLSGLRGGLGPVTAVLVVGVAFGINHHSVHRLIVTSTLGIVFGLLVLRYRSLWPAIVAHFLHNAISGLSGRADALQPLLDRLGFAVGADGMPPLPWVVGAGVLTAIGVVLCLYAPAREIALESAARTRQDEGLGSPEPR
jgi:ABC-2 type transport system permease protein/sodium transport system permease protein